jgi:hypothetical protein
MYLMGLCSVSTAYGTDDSRPMDGANKFDCPLTVKSTVKKFNEQKISRKGLFLSRDVKIAI